MGTDFLPFAAIDGSWMSERIPVNGGGATPNVMQLLKAFHKVWPTEVVQSIIDAAGENSFYQHDESTMPPGCHGIVYMDCEDFNWAYYRHVEGEAQDVEARAYPCDNGHTLFVITFAGTDGKVQPFCCFYDYDPAKKTITPEPDVLKGYRWGDRKEFTQIYTLLPRKGKNVVVHEWGSDGPVQHLFTWDGMKPVFSKTEPLKFDD
jgi:hypothetical protein